MITLHRGIYVSGCLRTKISHANDRVIMIVHQAIVLSRSLRAVEVCSVFFDVTKEQRDTITNHHSIY